jgi:WD40 repeat protein
MSQSPPEPKPLPSPPKDGITSLLYLPQSSSFSGFSSLLAASSWDGTVRVYDTQKMEHVCTQSMESGPVLSLAVDGNGQSLFTGGLDGSGEFFKRGDLRFSISFWLHFLLYYFLIF